MLRKVQEAFDLEPKFKLIEDGKESEFFEAGIDALNEWLIAENDFFKLGEARQYDVEEVLESSIAVRKIISRLYKEQRNTLPETTKLRKRIKRLQHSKKPADRKKRSELLTRFEKKEESTWFV